MSNLSKFQLPEGAESRYLEVSLRAAGDTENPTIEGEAAVFNVETVVGRWFREKLRPGAFTRVLSENPDVVCAFNHDLNMVLGRTTAGTLKLEQTDKALRYTAKVNPNDAQAMSVYEKVKRGDVNQASFHFTVRKEEWTEPLEDSTDQLATREIIEIGQLFDVGPCTFGQYPEASAQARSKSEDILQKRSAQAASSDAEGLEARQKARLREIDLTEKSIYSK
jgi:uncharacterized protein